MSQAPGYEPGSTGTRTKQALCVSYAIPYVSSLDGVKWRGERTNLPLGGVRLTVTSFFLYFIPRESTDGNTGDGGQSRAGGGRTEEVDLGGRRLEGQLIPPPLPPGVPRRPPPRGRESSPPVSGAGRPQPKSPWRGRGKLDPSGSMMLPFFLSPDQHIRSFEFQRLILRRFRSIYLGSTATRAACHCKNAAAFPNPSFSKFYLIFSKP
jgi:hypothetical protein